MSDLPQIGNWGAEFGQAMANLGGGIGGIINPNQDAQARMRQMLIQDPSLKQKLIDMEAMNPGSVAQMYGKWATNLGQGTMSTGAEMEVAQRGLAGQSVGQVTNTDTVAAQSYLNKNDIGDKTKQAAASQTYKYNGLGIDRLEQEKASHDALVKAAGGEANIAAADWAVLQDRKTKIDRSIADNKLADTTMTKYNGDLGKIANDIAFSVLNPDGAKEKGIKSISWEEQNALASTNPQFKDALDKVYTNMLEQQAQRNRLTLTNQGRANQDELMAKGLAMKYDETARQLGGKINIDGASIAYDPVKAKDVFQMGLGAALKSKDPEIVKQAKLISQLDQATGDRYTGMLKARAGQAAQKLLEFASRIQKGGKNAIADPIQAGMLKTAVGEYNDSNTELDDIANMTGKPIDKPVIDVANVKGGLFSFGKTYGVLSFSNRAAGNGGTDQLVADYKAELQAGRMTAADITNSTKLTPTQKSAILGK